MKVVDLRRETGIEWKTHTNGRRWYTRDAELHRHPECWVLLDRPRDWRYEANSHTAVAEAYRADLAREAEQNQRAAEVMAAMGWNDFGHHPVAGRLYRSEGGWIASSARWGLLRGNTRAEAAERMAQMLQEQADEWRRLADALGEGAA